MNIRFFVSHTNSFFLDLQGEKLLKPRKRPHVIVYFASVNLHSGMVVTTLAGG